MIQIIPFSEYTSEEALNLRTLPTELQSLTAAYSIELLEVISLQHTYHHTQALPISEEGLFVVLKNGQLIGYGSVVASSDAPPTSGIGRLNNCFIIPTERQKGYGSQLFRYLRQYATLHFGILQLNSACPLRNQMGEYLGLN